MSGIYIPGVSVPADDTVLLRVYPEENGYHFVERIDGIDQDFLGSYWAVPVPPHGRLGDLDALKVSLVFAEETAKWAVPALRAVLMVIDEMPTIIPASEEEMK